MSNREKLILFCVGLCCAGLIIVSFVWNANKFYTNAYSPVVEKSLEQKQAVEDYKKANGEASDEPQAPGFKESDINKEHGDRYSTY